MTYAESLANRVMEQLNQRVDEIQDEMRLDHWIRMQEIDHEIERRENALFIKDCLSPFADIESWWANQDSESQDRWVTLYQEFQYGPNGDMAISDGDVFSWEVVSFLRGRDSYLKQPFCAMCDSRGHKTGGCMQAH